MLEKYGSNLKIDMDSNLEKEFMSITQGSSRLPITPGSKNMG